MFANLDGAFLRVLILDVNIRDFNHVGRRWSSSLSRSQKRPKWREVKKVCSGSTSSSRSDLRVKTKWLSVVQELMTTTRQGVKQLSASESRAFPQSKILPCQRAVLLGETFYSFKLSWHGHKRPSPICNYQEPAMEDNDNAADDTNNRQEHKIRGLLFAGDKYNRINNFIQLALKITKP